MAEPVLQLQEVARLPVWPTRSFDLAWSNPRSLMSEDLFYVIVRDLQEEISIAEERIVPLFEAERCLESALQFLLLFRIVSGRTFVPPPAVAAGWRAFLRVAPEEYAPFCEQNLDVFVRYRSLDCPRPTAPTADFMRSCRLPFDEELWAAPEGDCEATVWR